MKVGIYVKLPDGNYKRLSLYGDESVQFQSKLADIEKLSNVFTDSTNDFTVPADKTNNDIFQHYYNIDIDGGFNANIKVDCYIEVDSFPFLNGKLELKGCKTESGIPTNYRITFTGELTQLTELFGEDTIDKLDYVKQEDGSYIKAFSGLSQYNFDRLDYKKTLNDPSFMNGNLITPLIAYTNRDWNYGSNDVLDITSDAGKILSGELKQAIRAIQFIESIEDKYNLTFSRDFLGTASFMDLFLWLNNPPTEEEEENEFPIRFVDTPNTLINSVSGTTGGPINTPYVGNDVEYISSGSSAQSFRVTLEGTDNTDTISVIYGITPADPTVTYNFGIGLTNGADVTTDVYQVPGTNAFVVSSLLNLDNVPNLPYLEFRLLLRPFVTSTFDIDVKISRYNVDGDGNIVTMNTKVESLNNMVTYVIEKNVVTDIPKMKVIDFLTGIMKMFKLIIRPTSKNSFYLDTLDNYYNRNGNILDITKYVDEEVNIDKPLIYKDIKFKYEKTKNILGYQFRKLFDPIADDIGYGDLKYTYDAITTKDKLEVTLPFENMLFERLTRSVQAGDNVFNVTTPIVIGQAIAISDSNEFSPNDCKPILFYNTGLVKLETPEYAPIKFSLDGTLSIDTVDTFYEIGNANSRSVGQITDCINWGIEIDPYLGITIPQCLFNNYWKNWIDTIYSTRQRKFNFTAYLPPRYIEELSLNDRLIIGSNRYKISDFTVNLIDGKTKLNLFTDIYEFGPSPEPVSIASYNDTNQYVTNDGVRHFDININLNQPWSAAKVDTGDGVGWLTLLNSSGNGLGTSTIRIGYNSSGVARQANIDITIGGDVFTVIVRQ